MIVVHAIRRIRTVKLLCYHFCCANGDLCPTCTYRTYLQVVWAWVLHSYGTTTYR